MSSRTREAEGSSDLWRTLALLRDGEFCEADWRRRLGAGYGAAAGFLEILPGTVADSFPDPQSGLPLVPRRVADGTYTARPDDPEVTRVEAVRGIAPAAVVRRRLRWDRAGAAVAAALGIEPHPGPGPFESAWVQGLGVLRTRDAVLPALLLVAKAEGEALGWVRHLLHSEARVLILPFHDPLCADLAAAHGHGHVALDRDTGFTRVKGRWELKARAAVSRAPVPSGPWSKAELQKVEVVGEFNLIRFADGFEINLRGRAKCRAYLGFLMARCLRLNEFVFEHETVLKDYNDTRPVRVIKSDRLEHDLFRKVNGCERLFEPLDRTQQRFRLLIRPR